MERKVDRFDKYMKAKGLNDNKVTIALGLSVGKLGKSRKENRDLSQDLTEEILNFYTDLSRTWLLTGEGEMLRNGAIIQQIGDKSSNNMQVAGGSDVVMLKKENEHLKELLQEKERTIKILMGQR